MATQQISKSPKVIKADSRGRINLGSQAINKRYRVQEGEHGEFTLILVISIPEREQWLWNNPEALASLKAGLKDAAEGRVHDLGSFAQYADLDTED